MLRIPLPEKRFFLRVLIINFMTLSCAAILGAFISTSPPLLSTLKSFLSIRLSKGNFFLLGGMATGRVACSILK